MTDKIFTKTGSWTCPKCGHKAKNYSCVKCGFAIYAGFGPRLLSLLADFLVLLIPISILTYLRYLSYDSFMIVGIVSFVFFRFYYVYTTGKWGGTPGKLMAGVKVLQLDGSKIEWSNAWLRNSVEMMLVLFLEIGYFIALTHISGDEFNSMTFTDKTMFLYKNSPWSFHLFNWLNQIYVWSELVVLLMNQKRRAIHDFIAGTVVVHLPKKSTEVPKIGRSQTSKKRNG
jgi:uncharacterized RDD family membrane protein YckC